MRIQPKKIMCAIDFSNFTDETLLYSVALCKVFYAKLFLVHIISDVNTAFVQGGITINRTIVEDQQISDAQELLGNLAKEIPIDHDIVICKGDPAEEIRRLALEEKIDMVITATHGKSGIKRLLIGSVTENLIRTLHCPLLVLSTHEQDFIHPGDYEIKLKKILVGCDFSPDSKLAFDYGLSLAQEFQAELYLAHVIKPTEHIELKPSDYITVIPRDYYLWEPSDYHEIQKEVTKETQEKISKLYSRLKQQLLFMVPEECQIWCSPYAILLRGEPYRELIQYGREKGVDMIVLGIRGHTLWETLMVGSTTDRVIRDAFCPVLAVQPMDEYSE